MAEDQKKANRYDLSTGINHQVFTLPLDVYTLVGNGCKVGHFFLPSIGFMRFLAKKKKKKKTEYGGKNYAYTMFT